MRTPGSRLLASILITGLLMPACHTPQQVDAETPLGTVQQASGVDSDCDGIADSVELQYGLDPMNPDDAGADPDGDDVSTIDEIRLGSNPLVADSDGNGTPDGIDLQIGRDLDGDGVPTPFDNCPKHPNKTQRDSDGDGIGDACDGDAPSVAIAEAYARSANDYALLPLGGGVVSRQLADRGELLPMPSSFRVFANASAAFATHALRELYHPTTKDHAYVTLDTDRSALVRVGYADLGVLGYLADAPVPFDGSIAVRRFAHATLKQEAVTIDATTAQQLLASGYVEKPKLGYAILDNGHLRRPRSIIRYRRTGTTDSFRHQSSPIVAAGYASDGPRFRVLPEKIANARPLFRMRNNAYERLSTDPVEVEQFVAQGYANDGVLGWIVASPDALPTQPGLELWRLELAGKHRYSLDTTEIDGLVQGGWVKTKLLGYAFASRERPASCAGPTPVQRLESKLVSMAAHPEERAVATLTAIVTSCSLERVIDGNVPANSIEQTIANKLPIDPEVRRRLRANAARWDAIDPTLRAQALDRYAALDPGPCTGPIDVATLRDRVHDLWFDYSGAPPSLREPFCDGTTYAPTDPAAGTQVAARAVTVDGAPSGEFGDSNGAKPRLQGVLATQFVRGHPAAQAWATAHPEVGFSVNGVSTGISCSATMPCIASQGLRCVSGTCRAYPIVRNEEIHTFTGTNFWDVVDGDVVLRDTVTGAVSRLPDEIISNEPTDDQRCSPSGTTNRATIENPLPGTAGRFYEVEVVNKNGLYYEHAEAIPPDDATARANGRTIHVCWRPTDLNRPPDTITDCSLVNTTAAACPLDGPTCSAATGGVWGAGGQAPRSLQFCQQNNLDCGETPREFSSRPANDNARQYIYVESKPPQRTLTTTLQDVTCHNETGTDWLGSDELAVMLTAFAGSTVAPNAPGIDISADAFQHSYDSGDNHTQLGFAYPSIKIDESGDLSTGSASYLLTLLEDDDGLIGTIVGLTIIAIAAAVVAFTWPATATILTAAGIAVLLGTAWTALMTNIGQNDPLGSDVFSATIADVTDRGAISHDLVYNALPPLPTFDNADHIRSFAGTNEVGVHPAVDGFARTENSEVTGIECNATTDCASSEVCAIGLCVPKSWWDAAPGSGTTPPGFIERREFLNGGKWRYDLYMSWQAGPPVN